MDQGFDMTASMHADLLRMCKGDKEKARQMVSGLQGQMEEEKRRAQQRKIDELTANFPIIDRDTLVKILTENDWDVEKAILPCFEFQEKEREAQRQKEREEQNKKREEERRARQAEARQQAKTFLVQLFSNVPEDKIQAMLEENEGDVDLTTDQLISMKAEEEEKQEEMLKRRKEEEEQLKRQAELERQLKIDTLVQRFGDYCSANEIVNILSKHNWDVKAASNDVLRLVEERKLEQLKRLYTTLDEVDIREALYKNDWNLIDTMKQLRTMQAQQKAKQEEEERRRQEREELEKAKQTAEEEAKARAEAMAREEAEAAAAEEKKKASKASKEAVDNMFLERSVIIGKELDEIIQAQRKIAEHEADPLTHIKQQLEEKLKFGPENLPGVPGMVPPTRKMIDKLLGKESPVPATPEQADQEDLPEKVKVLPTGMEFTEVDTAAVDSKATLRASPESLDIKQPITVEWEMETAPSSSDWIGLYKVGSDNGSYAVYNWISPVAKKGAMTFTPTDFGEYELRYFASSSSFFSRQYSVKAVSNPIRVGPQLKLIPSWDAATNMLSVKFEQKTGNQYLSAWVGLYAKTEKDNSQYRAFDWLSNAVDHTLKFACPKAGEWEFRFFPQRSYVDVARESVTVGGTDRVELSLVDGQMIVKTELTTVDPAYDNVWVGIYKTDETNNRQYRKYKYVSQASGTITFRACTTPSTYEARIFAHKGLDVVCRSNTIVVPPKQQ
jgi:hypothetical protein